MTTVGKVNIYACEECGTEWVVIEVAIGIVPNKISCKSFARTDCTGLCVSRNYQNIPIEATPTHELYRMSRAEARRFDRLHKGTFKYHQRGGLGVRPRKQFLRKT